MTHLVYSPQDFEGPYTLRPKLPAGQVLGREPDPVPRYKHGALTAVAVSTPFLPSTSLLKGFPDGPPGLFGALHPFLHCRSLGLARMPRCQDRLVPQHTH